MGELPVNLAFGRFQVVPHRREVTADGRPIKLGGRAFDVLTALIEARGEVVAKDMLMARVWPGQVVDENTLRTHVSDLRSAFGADHALIRTVSGRGYLFAGEVNTSPQHKDERSRPEAVTTAATAVLPPRNLPQPISELIGREEELPEIIRLATEHRLVTLTGPGGIGKTRLALEAARSLLAQFAEGACLAEFSPLSDPGLVPATVAAAAGIELPAGETSARRVAQALSERRLLLVIDTCEHVIGAATELAEAILHAGPAVHIIATSREPLRAEGERAYVVPPLNVPATAGEDPCQYSAIRLFAIRARASGAHIPNDQQVASAIIAICRQLDGIPLAIELAAARAATLGIKGMVDLLGDRFRLLGGGRRTAPPRHQTLRATLDWSYELLSETERVVLRRLAVFAGSFSRTAAGAVAGSPEISPSEAAEGVASLAAKSLVVVELEGHVARYRSLDSTRVYALEKLREGGEFHAVARRHAEYYRDMFEQAESDWPTRPAGEWLAIYGREIDNLRAALDWAFSPDGDAAIGVALTAAAITLWIRLSLIEECRTRIGLALNAGVKPDPRQEMKLQAGLGTALMYSQSATDPEVAGAWARALERAESLGDIEYQLHALLGVWSAHIRGGHHRIALDLAQRFYGLAKNSAVPINLMTGERMLGVAAYLGGNLPGARRHIENVLTRYTVMNGRAPIVRFRMDQRSASRALLVRLLWLQGFPDQAMRTAETSIAEAQEADHGISMCYVLALAACPVSLLTGNVNRAEHYIQMLLACSRKHALTLWEGWGRYYQGILLTNSGDRQEGARLIRTGLGLLGSATVTARFVTFLGEAAAALGRTGQLAAALAKVDEAIAEYNEAPENWLIADVVRSKGDLLLLQGGPDAAAYAKGLFWEALDLARRYGTLSVELRAAISFARLLCAEGCSAEARALLQPVYDRFTEGFDTADLKAARALLDAL